MATDGQRETVNSCEGKGMASFSHHFQAQQQSNKPKFATETLSLSVILQYAENAKKQSFEALCRLQPLVKSYRDKIAETSQAMLSAESSLGSEAEIPVEYAAALLLVKEGFATHLQALDEWMGALAQKDDPLSGKAIERTKQSGAQLESALSGLTIKV